MMTTEALLAPLLAAASWLKEPAGAVAGQALRDVYAATKYYLRRTFAPHPDATKALDLALEKPTSAARRRLLVEEAAAANLAADPEMERLAQQLAALLPGTGPTSPQVHVAGSGHAVHVAGRDLIVTARQVRRVAITPDERHLMHAQRRRLLHLIHSVAARLTAPPAPPNLAAVHAMLQRRFEVPSYLLIPRERYAEALQFLEQQRAIHRPGLRRRDPAAFRRELLRAIFGRAAILGWARDQVRAFARDQLNQPTLASLQTLSARQLACVLTGLRRAPAPPAPLPAR
jgi:hypothetical protein